MFVSNLLIFLPAFAAAVSATALPQQREQRGVRNDNGLAKRQSNMNKATIPIFSFGPSDTVPVASGPVASTTTTRAASGTTTVLSPAKTTTKARSTATKTTKASSTATTASPAKTDVSSGPPASSGTAVATGTIPVFDYFPSSTVPVAGGATSQPSTGTGAGAGNGRGNKTGNGSGKATGGQADTSDTELADLLNKLLDLLKGN